MEGWGRNVRRKMIAATVVAAALAAAGCVSLPEFWRRGDGQIVTTEHGSCVVLTPELALQPVTGCDRDGRYELSAAGRRLEMAGGDFRRLLRERLLQFARTTDYPWRTLSGARIEVWLVAPVFAPADAYLMAEVLGPGGNFAVRLNMDPRQWHFDGDAVLWLGREVYPSRQAKRAGMVQVAARPHVTPAAFSRYLRRAALEEMQTAAGAPAVRQLDSAGMIAVVHTQAFSEQAVAKRLAAQPEADFHLQDVSFVPAAESEGARAVVFRFPFLD